MVRHVSPPVPVGTTATLVYIISIGRRAKLKKVLAYNSGASAATIMFTTPAGDPLSPPIAIGAGANLIIGEQDLPEMEFYGGVYAAASASGVILQVEVDEF